MMDTSKIYVKMCEKAEEIQKIKPEWNLEGDDGEWWYPNDNKREVNHIWLPRQDQLQEILFTHKEHLFPQCVLLREFIREGELYILHFLKSMEQLWLAFAMKEKYNKIWNGEDWVKEIE